MRLGLGAAHGGVPARGAGPESPGPSPRPRVCSSRQLHPPLCFSLAKKLTFNQARKSLGLHHCRQFFNLGLGLPRATMDYFLSLNMPIFELYGLSESTGIHTLSRQQDFRLLRWVLVEGWADGGQGCREGGWPGLTLNPCSLAGCTWSPYSVLPPPRKAYPNEGKQVNPRGGGTGGPSDSFFNLQTVFTNGR